MTNRICWIVSSPLTVQAFLMPHLAALSQRCDVTVMANTEDFGFLAPLGPRVRGAYMGIERKISPFRDLVCLVRLFREFRVGTFAVVHSVTPKAGFLAMIAARLACVPVRIHWFTGQVWATRSGASRALLRRLDKLTARLATHLLVDSPSQLGFLVTEAVAPRGKMEVLGCGSICGVDPTRFKPNPAARAETRESLGIQLDAMVLLFVGRCTADKGLTDLAVAFEKLCGERDDVFLVIVGPDEQKVIPAMLQLCPRGKERLRRIDYTNTPEHLMAAADVFCLPSYREGFGAVVIEAAAAGVPSVGSRIYGVTDAIQDGVTGLLHKPGDAQELFEKIYTLTQDDNLRRVMGSNARARAIRDFDQHRVTSALVDYYRGVVGDCTDDG